ncbi:MAG: SDR family oxidoreductase [Acidobacteriia bacterium]|nr:SDR family oxidoreductase [Terriglobia bacterium]
MTLAGRVALVTGAGRGIGKAIAHVLTARGMAVGVNDGEKISAEDTAEELRRAGGRALALPADISRKAEVEAMVERAENELGPLWLLVNNAGVFFSGPTVDMSEEAWDRAFEVDAKGVFLCSQAVIRRMLPRRAGRIVNVSSIAGIIVRTNQIAYCAAKAAVVHFSRCLAVELAPHGITVNCLCPGMTRTPMLVEGARERGMDLAEMVRLIPAGRMAEPEDHAHLVAYFASDEAAHVTGQVVAVDGGQSQYLPLVRPK